MVVPDGGAVSLCSYISCLSTSRIVLRREYQGKASFLTLKNERCAAMRRTSRQSQDRLCAHLMSPKAIAQGARAPFNGMALITTCPAGN
jgi:hypothetical protein